MSGNKNVFYVYTRNHEHANCLIAFYGINEIPKSMPWRTKENACQGKMWKIT